MNREYHRAYYAKNKERIAEQRAKKRAENPEAVRAKGRERYAKKREAIADYMRKWREENPEKIRKYTRAWEVKNREKQRAHYHVKKALADGRLTRQPCEVCGAAAHAHHDDYSKPLEVRWLCQAHHNQHHAATKAAAMEVFV